MVQPPLCWTGRALVKDSFSFSVHSQTVKCLVLKYYFIFCVKFKYLEACLITLPQ